MSEQNKKEQVLEGKEELSLDDLEQVSGGAMRDHIVVTKTTDISEDTKKKI